MRWLFRAFLFLAFIALAVLAALPYLPKLEHEAKLFYTTWQKVRKGEVVESLPENPEPQTLKPATDHRRKLVTPDLLAAEAKEAETADDSFILEARRRAKDDPTATMKWLQSQHSGSERLRGMLEVVALWAAEDSESALLWLESNAQGLARLETLNNGVELWAQRNPIEASEWIDGMANDGSKATAAKALASKWVQSEPEAAAEWVAGLPNGPIREEAKEALVESWVVQDAKAASIWAFAEAEFNGDYDLLGETIREYSKQSPADAEAFVRDMLAADYSQIALTSHVMGRAEEDPASTAEWLATMSLEDPIYSAEYANGLMQVWAQSDSIAASDWLSQQPQGAQRDAAVYGFSESIQRFEPEAAAAWANTIDDPDRRVMRLTDSVRLWADTDLEAAIEWVQTAELEPAIRQFLASDIAVEIPIIRLDE